MTKSLCSCLVTGQAPDADQMFAPITVPIVQDLIDKQQDPPAASFLAAPPMDPRHSNRRSASSQGGNQNTNKPVHGPASSHITTEQRSNSISSQSSFFRTSTPSFQFDYGQPFFGAGKANAAAATSTPVESQGAAFRFGEADVRDEEDEDIRRIRARSREPSAGPRLSTSIDDGPATADESSFWNPGAARKAKAQGLAGNGGLFGFAASAKSAPLFGQGLLFGQNGASKQEGSRSGSMSAGSGGFFTPLNAQNGTETPDAAAAPGTSKIMNGRPAPAAKRSINQIDESAPDDSFHFQFQSHQRRQQQPGGPSNGLVGHASGDVEEILIDDGEGGHQNGIQDPVTGLPRPTYARKNSHLLEKLGRGVNGNHAPFDTSIAGGNFAAKANRIVSNPREKKRSRAGPSNFDDASTTTASSSHSVDTNGALYHASSSSSSPPAGQSENEPHGYALPSIVPPRHGASAEQQPTRPVTTPAFHKSAPTASSNANLAVSQPLMPAPSVEREMSYRKQLEAAQNALAENWLRSIFRLFAKAQSCMSKYDCSEAIKAVLSLPKEQRNSTRAILLLGEASFESLEYAKVSVVSLCIGNVVLHG